MAVALDATPKGASANSWGTLEEADAYFAAHLYAGAWSEADQDTQARALIAARRHIEQSVVFRGARTTVTQALELPRTSLPTRSGDDFLDHNVVPVVFKEAQFEQALVELAGNRTADPGARGITRVKADTVEVEFDGDASQRTHLLADHVWGILAPWIVGGPSTANGIAATELVRV